MLNARRIEVSAAQKKPDGIPAGLLFFLSETGFTGAKGVNQGPHRPPKFFFACGTDLLIWQ